jgi:hypothetical protein
LASTIAERGRYDTQAVSKTTLLFIGGYEAETTVCDVSGLSVGDMLMVDAVTVGGVANKRGLKKLSASSGQHLVFGYVTRLPGGGKVRYWKDMGWKTV